MPEIPDRKKAFDDFWNTAEVRRKMHVLKSSKGEDEVAKAIYMLCAELCCLEQLLIMQISKPSKKWCDRD